MDAAFMPYSSLFRLREPWSEGDDHRCTIPQGALHKCLLFFQGSLLARTRSQRLSTVITLREISICTRVPP
jgi:hypothetical protein